MAGDLPQHVNHDGSVYNIITIDGFCGSLHTGQSNPPNYTLIDALGAAFKVSPKVILQLGGHGQAYASMIEYLGPKKGYFIFDSHARDENGLPDGNGSAVQLSCISITRVSAYIASLARELAVVNEQFELCPIFIHKVNNVNVRTKVPVTAESSDVPAHASTDEDLLESSTRYMQEQEKKARLKEQTRISKSRTEVKQQIFQTDKAARQESNVRKYRLQREKQQRSQPDVKDKRASRRAVHDSRPEIKERRASRETEQRSQPEVRKRRASRRADHDSQPNVKKRRTSREVEQRSQPEVREQRASQRADYDSQPNVKKRRASREVEQRSQPEVREQRASQRADHDSQPNVKKRRTSREVEQRSQPEVRKRRASQRADHDSQPNVKKRRASREVEQRSQPEVREQRASQRADHDSQPNVKKRRTSREVEQRSQPEVRKRRASQRADYDSQPNVKKRRTSREVEQRSQPEVREQRASQRADHDSQPNVKKRRASREARQRSQPEVTKRRASKRAVHNSQPEIKTRRARREAEQRSQPSVKKQRTRRERVQRSLQRIKERRAVRQQQRRNQPHVQESERHQDKQRREREKGTRKQVSSAVKAFKKKTAMIPECVCAICNRIQFRNQVKLLTEQHWANHRETLQKCSTDEESAYICIYCERFIQKDTVPPLSLHGNKLQTAELPGNLQDLNTLERFLITPVLPFMKIVSLPSGLQKGIHGPVVCVPSNMEDALTALPRPIDDTGLIKVKLKRKLCYKGHHLYQQVRTVKVMETMQYLKKNHKDFKDITVSGEIPHPDTPHDDETTCMIAENEPTNSDSTDEEDSEAGPSQTSTPLVTCLQPEDPTQFLADNYEDEILCLAPGEGNTPESVRNKEAVAFPTLFPDGTNAFSEAREIRLTFSQYIKSRLLSQNNKYASNPEYIFFLQFLKENEEVMSSARMSLRKAAQPQSGNVSAGEIVQQGNLKNLVQKNHGYKFLTKVRGSAPYWQGAMRDLCAMVRQLGLPTWFCSFSAADRRWPEIVQAIFTAQGKEVPEEMDWTEHCQAINSNPVIAALMFDRRVQSLLTNMILSDANIIGEVADFFYRVEFQQRGWPHIHGIFWIRGAPQLEQTGGRNDEEVCLFIDRFISTKLPDENTDPELHEKVSSVQTHSKRHSRTCRKGNKVCRFNFPKPASTRTFICRPREPPGGEDLEAQKAVAARKLQVYWDALNDEESATKTANDVLAMAGLTQEEFEAAMCTVTEKVTVIHKREPSEIWINPYNPTLLNAWNANLDIQYIVDAYSCIAYILSYISKKEAEEGELLKAAQKEAREGNQDAVSELRKIGQTYLTHREVSIMEAVYRALGINLKKSSREVKWIATGDDATRMTLPIKTLQIIARRDSDCTEIFQTSDLEKYWCRPRTDVFNDMCLADFVANFKVIYSGSRHAEEGTSNEADVMTMTLLDGKGRITKRRNPAVLRYMKVPYAKNPEQHFMHLLKLFVPHRSRTIRPETFETNEEFVKSGTMKTERGTQQVQNVLETNAAKYDVSATNVEDALDEVLQNGVAEEAWAQVAPNAETLRDGAPQPDTQEEDDMNSILPDLNQALPQRTTTTTTSAREPVPGMSKEDAHKLIRCMNVEQRKIFMTVRGWCITAATSATVQPFYIYLTGGAGTGKSHVVKAVEFEASAILQSTSLSPDDVTILKVAYTGTAAFNISGQTIHSAFRIGINTSRAHGSYKYQPLGEDLLTTLRAKYRSLQILVIDEVSMVGRKMMLTVSERLKQIKRCQKPFGGVSILAVGDFYQIAPVGDTAVYKDDPGQIIQSPWSIFKVWELHQIMRQKDDFEYAQLLNSLRSRHKESPLSVQEVNLLISRRSEESDVPDDTLHIYSRNREVDAYNTGKLFSACIEIQSIKAADVYVSGTTEKLRRTPVIGRRMMLQDKVEVAAGARVMLTTNLDVADGLSNGVLGTVVKIESEKTQHNQPKEIHIKFDNDSVGRSAMHANPASIARDVVVIRPAAEDFNHQGSRMKRYQYPLKLAWACTIHKTQGMTLASAAISLDHIFLPGMAYVALSRISSIDGLYLLDFDERYIYCEPQIKQVMQNMEQFPCQTLSLLDDKQEGTDLLIVSMNVHSLRRHISDVQSDPELLTADILGFSETWLTSRDQLNQLMIEGYYEPIRSDRPSASGRGGVALYMKKGLKHTCVQDISLDGMECVVVDIEGLIVCLIYRPPSYQLSRLNQQIKTITDKISTNRGIVICGDFNVDVKESSHDVQLEALQHYQQEITNTTYYDNRGHTSLIDHIYTRDCMVKQAGVISTYYSDHDATFIKIRLA